MAPRTAPDGRQPERPVKGLATAFTALTGVAMTAHQALIFMALLKLSRSAHNPDHRDSVVDLAGYAACIAQVQEAQAAAATDPGAP